MKKVFGLLALVSVFSVSALAQDAALLGTWQTQPMVYDGGLTLQMSITFTDTQVIMANVCSMGGSTVTASVTGTYQADAGMLSTSSSSQSSQALNGLTCDASIQPMSMSYQVMGNVLQMIADGQVMILTKI